jgi:hypothetical protein
MLSKEDLKRLAKARGLSPWQEEKRYVQALVLYALRSQQLVFKGGTYLWFFHGLDRFSEDLDFTAQAKVDQRLMSNAADVLLLFGVYSYFKTIKDDRFVLSFRIDARGPLYNGPPDLCRVYVEVSRREAVALRSLTNKLDEPQYALPIDFVAGMDLVEVVAEKVRALLRRRAVRDLYDLWYLLIRKEVAPDLALIDRKLSFYETTFDVSELERSLSGLESAWETELPSVVLGSVPPLAQAKADVLRTLKGLR